jgi:peptidyl-dipeptidase Dcp
VRAERFDLDESEVKNYFQLDNMIEAQFYVATRLFGVTFNERTDIPTYHPDVRVWEMLNGEGEVVGLFYGDYFARPGKRGGAWMSSFRAQNGISGDIPIIINNCNYNKPADGEPALLSFIDASTLFHEFGHGLHGLLSNTDFPSLAGTAVDRDFVEFPAQIYEHWLEQPEILERFAVHYETGEPMPAEMLERLMAAGTFNQGFATVEFLNSGFVDMAYHLHEDPMSIDIAAFEEEVLSSRQSPEQIPMRHRSTHFLHTFAGEGYRRAITAICGRACSIRTASPPSPKRATSSIRSYRSACSTASSPLATLSRPWTPMSASAAASPRSARCCATAASWTPKAKDMAERPRAAPTIQTQEGPQDHPAGLFFCPAGKAPSPASAGW